MILKSADCEIAIRMNDSFKQQVANPEVCVFHLLGASYVQNVMAVYQVVEIQYLGLNQTLQSLEPWISHLFTVKRNWSYCNTTTFNSMLYSLKSRIISYPVKLQKICITSNDLCLLKFNWHMVSASVGWVDFKVMSRTIISLFFHILVHRGNPQDEVHQLISQCWFMASVEWKNSNQQFHHKLFVKAQWDNM